MRKNVFIPGIWKACGVKSIAFNHYNNYIPFFTRIASIFTYSVQTQLATRLQGFINVLEQSLNSSIKELPGILSHDLNVNRRGKPCMEDQVRELLTTIKFKK